MRILAIPALILLAACGSGAPVAPIAPTSAPAPVAPTTVDRADYGYKGSATFEAPEGSDDFVALGADPTGATDSLPVLLDWFASDGPHGRDVLLTTNTHLNGARVSDPYGEMVGD